jgi:hypothetical protein
MRMALIMRGAFAANRGGSCIHGYGGRMITLTSKESAHITVPGPAPASPILGTETVLIETGVAVFALTGTIAHDWTRDTLTFPVGVPCPPGAFVRGIAAASPASFWTPYAFPGSTAGPDVEPVLVQQIPNTQLGGALVFLPPLGFAVDAASVAYSSAAGQPTLTLALAVFGVSTALLRVSYTAYVVTRQGAVVAGSAGSERV